ncbi:MAG: GNAT family N-acetyltransferase [Acidobacteriota bacterium]
MPRAPLQAHVLPYRRDAGDRRHAIFKRSDAGWWQVLAGGGEDDETPLEAAVREAGEEAGIPPTASFFPLQTRASVPRECFGGCDHWPSDLDVVTAHHFAVDVTGLELTLSHEHDEFRWVTLDEAVQLTKWHSDNVARGELERRLARGELTSTTLRPPRLDVELVPTDFQRDRDLVLTAERAAFVDSGAIASDDTARLDDKAAGSVRSYEEQVAAGTGWACSALLAGRAVGFVFLDLDGGAFLSNVHVDDEHRGRGVGRSLVESALAEANRQELAPVRLAVTATNGHARRLYRSLGFKVERYLLASEGTEPGSDPIVSTFD